MVFCAFCAVTPVSEGENGVTSGNEGDTSVKTVTTEADLRDAVKSESTYTKVILGANITVTGTAIEVLKSNIEIDGAGYKLTAAKATSTETVGSQVGGWFTGSYPTEGSHLGKIYVLNVQAASNIHDINIDCAKIACGGVNVANGTTAETVTLKNVNVTNYYGAGFVLGYKTVSISECSAETSVENNWAGMNVDKKANVTIDSISGFGFIYAEDGAKDTDRSTVTITSKDNATYAEGTEWEFYSDGENAYKILEMQNKAIEDAASKTKTVGTAPSGALVTTLNILKDANLYGKINEGLAVNIADNATAKVPAKKTLEVNEPITFQGKNSGLDVDGELKSGEGLDGNSAVTSEGGEPLGTVTFGPDSKSDAKIENVANVVVDPAAMKDAYLGGEIGETENEKDLYFGKNQVVNIIESLVIMKGATVTIEGKLVVPEGMSITIEAGGNLVLQGGYASAEINGSIVIEGNTVNANGTENNDAGEFVINGDSIIVEVDGNVQVDGILSLKAGTIVFNSAATISEDGNIQVESGKIRVAETGDLTIEGWINEGEDNSSTSRNLIIENYGKVTFDSMNAVGGSTSVEVDQMVSGAVVDIKNYSLTYVKSALTVTDKSMKVGKTAIEADKTNKIVISVGTYVADAAEYTYTTSGLLITSTAKLDDNKKVSATMDISGNIAAVDTYEEKSGEENKTYNDFTISGKKVTISTELSISENDKIAIEDTATSLTVSGKLDASADGSKISNKGKITVKGDGIISTKDKTAIGTINATEYVTKDTDNKSIYNYVTLDAALTLVNEDTTITALTAKGTQKLTESNTVPAKVTLTVEGEINVGCEDHEKVQLTIEKDGKMTVSGTVKVVDGIVLAKDKTKVTASKIESDVTSYEIDADGKIVKNGWQKWTTLAIALDEANPGETIIISGKNVEIDSNLTIDEGVTVKVPADVGTFTIMDGVTFTVDGVLETEIDIGAETRFAGTAADRFEAKDSESTDSSVIVINGQVKTAVGFKYNVETEKSGSPLAWQNTSLSAGAPVSCAVFKDAEDYIIISPLAVALENIEDAESNMTLYGTIAAGDIVFEANENGCDALIVANETKFTATSVKLVGSTLNVNDGAKFNGSVIIGDVTVAFENVQNFTVTDNENEMTFGVANIESNVDDAKNEKASVTLVSGTLVGKTDLDIDGVKFIVGSGATLTAEGASFGTLVIEGTVTVAAGKRLTVNNDGQIIGGGVLSVTAATSTTASGEASFGTLYVGDVMKETTGAAATVNGPVSVTNQMFVAADATLDAEALNALENVNKTEFMVEGSLWMTVYDFAKTYTIDSVSDAGSHKFDIPVKNAEFDGWENADGKTAGTSGGEVNAKIGDDGWKTVNAKINKEVYIIAIMANTAINDIYLDGQLMIFDNYGESGPSAYYALVSAGSHNIEYTLEYRYGGDAKLEVYSGSGLVQDEVDISISNTTITVSGGDDLGGKRLVILQLTGIEKVDAPVTPVAPTNDDGMGITDYLLIILVVLIVVMAIIVAMRLMRS